MAKRLSEKEKEVIVNKFTEGSTIDELSLEFDCTKLTIKRNLKKRIADEKYKELINKSKINNSDNFERVKIIDSNEINNFENSSNVSFEELKPITSFTELVPLNFEIETSIQRDLSSVPINEVNLPKMVYMIVDRKIELETKLLREYPDWQFLSEEELNRKTIEIHLDLKIAKRTCNKEQKVIKVPNPNVFKIVAPILINRGITRIVCPEQLIAL